MGATVRTPTAKSGQIKASQLLFDPPRLHQPQIHGSPPGFQKPQESTTQGTPLVYGDRPESTCRNRGAISSGSPRGSRSCACAGRGRGRRDHRGQRAALRQAVGPGRRAAVREGRERGYAFLDSAVFPGTAAVGVAFPAAAPLAAVSVAAISARLDATRRVTVATALQRQVRTLERMLAGARQAS